MAYDLYDVSGSGTTYTVGSKVATNQTVTASGGNSNNVLGDNANDGIVVGNGGGNGQGANTYKYLGLAESNGTAIGFFAEIPGSNQVVLFVLKGASASGTLTLVADRTNNSSTWWNLNTDSQYCFTAGTMILTPGGEVAVESLAAGDLVSRRMGGLFRSGGSDARPSPASLLTRCGLYRSASRPGPWARTCRFAISASHPSMLSSSTASWCRPVRW